MKKHKHCWHIASSWTNGLGVDGGNNEVCCHCGRKQVRPWKLISDPAHGPYAEMKIYKYGKPRPHA